MFSQQTEALGVAARIERVTESELPPQAFPVNMVIVLQGGQSGVLVWSGCTLKWGTGNIDSDPCFVHLNGLDGIIGTKDDVLRLSPDSNCIDAGDNTGVSRDTTDLDEDGDIREWTPLDLAGNARFTNDPNTVDTGNPGVGGLGLPVVDMGAYERYEFCGSGTYPYPPGDLSGPDGIRDCKVNFYNIAVLAAHWLEDVGPQ